MRKRRVLIIHTGGTIGMDSTLRVASNLRARLFERAPELRQLAQCDVRIALNRDSAHIGPADWEHIAETLRSHWRQYDGFVLLHGTDTLAYTASALSFLLRPCDKPVVITGAQRPLAAIRTDARRNLISAVEIAAQGPRAELRRVTVFFDDLLLAANRVRKRSASHFAAFESPHAEPVAEVGTEIHFLEGARRAVRARKGPVLAPTFSRNVVMLHVTPGFPARALRERLLPTLDGLVLVVYASGTAPTHDAEFLGLLREAKKRGTPVVAVTEGASLAGSVTHPENYEAGRLLLREGCSWAGELTPECAYVKASLLLGQKNGRAVFARHWKTELAGEGAGARGGGG